jgi:hypothetical protein
VAGVNQAAGRQLAIAGLDNRLTDGGKYVSPIHRSLPTPQIHNFSASDIYFC